MKEINFDKSSLVLKEVALTLMTSNLIGPTGRTDVEKIEYDS